MEHGKSMDTNLNLFYTDAFFCSNSTHALNYIFTLTKLSNSKLFLTFFLSFRNKKKQEIELKSLSLANPIAFASRVLKSYGGKSSK